MDRVCRRKTGLRFLPAVECSPEFRSHLWLSLQSERTLATGPAQLWQAMGLERAAHNVVRSGLARNFSGSADRSRHARRARGRIEHSRARIEISSGRRSAYAQPGGPRSLQATCSNLSHSRRAARQFRELSACPVRRTPGKSARDGRAIGKLLRLARYHATIGGGGGQYPTGTRKIDIVTWHALPAHVHEQDADATHFTCIASSQRMAARSNSVSEVTPNF